MLDGFASNVEESFKDLKEQYKREYEEYKTIKQKIKNSFGNESERAVLCMYDEIPTMIFDEIDTGISGQAGKAVAEKMKLIGKTHQVICVTHLPVIAASGDANFFIEKATKNNRTITEVLRIDEDEVIKEIARILNGNDITNAVLEHSKEMRTSMK